MAKLFVVQTISFRNKANIIREQNAAKEFMEGLLDETFDIINPYSEFFTSPYPPNSLERLGHDILLLNDADTIAFVNDWNKEKNCRMLKRIVEHYGSQCGLRIFFVRV